MFIKASSLLIFSLSEVEFCRLISTNGIAAAFGNKIQYEASAI